MSLRSWVRFLLAVSVCAALSAPAFAQYGGGGMGGTGGTGGTGTYSTTGKSYGNGAAIGAGVGAAAGVGALVAYMVYHKATMTACVEQAADGFKVMDQKGNTYAVDTNGETLKAGEQFKLTGKKKADKSGVRTFKLTKSPDDLGPCSKETAKAQTQ
jgi:hypothetical protein